MFKILGFSVVGVGMTILSMLLIWLGNDVIHVNVYVTYLLSYCITILMSCYLNARYVWKHQLTMQDVIKYVLIYVSSMLLGIGVISLLEWFMPNANHTIISYCSLPFTFIWNYVFVNHIFKIKNGK